MEALLVVLSGLIDRICGSNLSPIPKPWIYYVYGWLISALLGHPFDWHTIFIATLFGYGCSYGWRVPGKSCNCVVDTPGKRFAFHVVTPWLWTMYLWPFAYFEPKIIYVVLGYAIAHPIAAYIGIYRDVQIWLYQEHIRAWIATSIIVIVPFLVDKVMT